MSNAFRRLHKTIAKDPPRIVIYGPIGIGKTTLASEFPNSVWLQTEDGTPTGVELNTFGKLNSYGEIIEVINDLFSEEHDFQTLVIDSVTALTPMINREAIERYNAENRTSLQSVDDIEWGKGPGASMRVWDEFIAALDLLRLERNMAIIMIGHSVVTEFKDPMTATYNRYDVGLPATDKPATNIRGRVLRDMDLVLFMNSDISIKQDDRTGVAAKSDKTTARVRAMSNKIVLGYATRNPSYEAKNRYNMPDQMRIDRGRGYAELAKFFPATSAATIAAEQKEAA